MKRLKMLGAAMVCLAALMATGGGTAYATEATCNGSLCAVGTVIHGVSEGKVVLHPPFGSIECDGTAEGKVSSAGSATTTPVGIATLSSLTNCNATVQVLAQGTGEIHTAGASSNGDGTATSSGTRVTIVYLGFHCIFETNKTDVGVLTGSNNTKGKATGDISATIPRVGGTSGAFCGSTAAMTGSVVINTPGNIVIH